MEVVEKMIEFRAKNDLSIEKAAQIAGVTKQTWAHVERGLQNPSRLTEAKIMLVVGGEEDDNDECK